MPLYQPLSLFLLYLIDIAHMVAAWLQWQLLFAQSGHRLGQRPFIGFEILVIEMRGFLRLVCVLQERIIGEGPKNSSQCLPK